MTKVEEVELAILRAATRYLDDLVRKGHPRGALTMADVPVEVTARAAIAAMMEPTYAMLQAVREPLIGSDAPSWAEEQIWQAMITAAMEE